jgi:hypothetical protein
VGSSAYFEKNPPPRTPGDLMRHHCIRGRLPSGAILGVFTMLGNAHHRHRCHSGDWTAHRR